MSARRLSRGVENAGLVKLVARKDGAEACFAKLGLKRDRDGAAWKECIRSGLLCFAAELKEVGKEGFVDVKVG